MINCVDWDFEISFAISQLVNNIIRTSNLMWFKHCCQTLRQIHAPTSIKTLKKTTPLTLREARIKPSSYRPTIAKLEEVVSFDTTPEEFIRRVLRPIKLVIEPDA